MVFNNSDFKKLCVIGHPIKHSKSPLIHNFWLDKYSINSEYIAVDVKPEELQTFFDNFNYHGCNVTIPHKKEVFKIVNSFDLYTKSLSAVNTVYWDEGKLVGANTDGYGFWYNIINNVENSNFNKVAILGAGGAVRSIVAALIAIGVREIKISNRTISKAEELSKEYGNIVKPFPWEERSNFLFDVELLVNGTSLGMHGQPELNICLSKLPKNSVVTDIVYNPLLTKLLKDASDRGNIIVDGLGMLLYQAAKSFQYWFDIEPLVENNLRDIIIKDL